MSTDTTDTRLVTLVLLLLAAAVLLPVLAASVGMTGIGPMLGGTWGGGMWGHGAAPGWMLLVGLVTRLLVLAPFVVAGYLVYRAVAAPDGGTDPALAELRLAYARGELSDEEYDGRREALDRD